MTGRSDEPGVKGGGVVLADGGPIFEDLTAVDPAALRALAAAVARLPALAVVSLDVSRLGLAPDAARALEADCRGLWCGSAHSMAFRLGGAAALRRAHPGGPTFHCASSPYDEHRTCESWVFHRPITNDHPRIMAIRAQDPLPPKF